MSELTMGHGHPVRRKHARRWIAVGLVAGLAVAGCRGDSDDDTADPEPTATTTAPINLGDPCDEAPPERPLPPGIEAADCRWTTQAEQVVGFGDAIIATAEVAAGRSTGEFVMRGLDAATGAVTWESPRLTVSYDDPSTDEADDGRRSLDVVHWGGRPYAAFTYLTPAARPGAVSSAVTFVPLTGSADPVTWVAPTTPDPMIATNQQYVRHDVVGAFVQATTLAVDPTVGDTRGIQTSWQGAQPTIGDGWFAETEYGKPGFTVKRFDGSVLWDSADHVPDFADDTGVYRYAVAAFRDRLLALWASCTNCGAPLVLVVHDGDGRVVGSGTVSSGVGDRVTSLLASPNEQWIVVTDSGVARAVVDLGSGTVTSLHVETPLGEPAPPRTEIRPVSVTDDGTVYARDGRGVALTLDGSTGDVTWTGDASTMLPSSLTESVAAVTATSPERTQKGRGGTTTWWGLGSGETARDELARRLAPLVYLAEGESNQPMDATTFVEHSELWWDHGDLCADDDPVAADPEPTALGDGDYTHQGVEAEIVGNDVSGCEHTGRAYRSDESDNEGGGSHGFTLDLDDDWRDQGDLGAPTYWQYYDHGDGTGAYVYWLFYPYNDYGTILEVKNKHEGDWERVAVRVDGDVPTAVTYWHHASKETCFLPWDEVDKDGEHPIAYSAKGSHGSYPTAGHQIRDNAPDDETSQGDDWQTWGDVQSAEAQAWWGYRGLWGSAGPALPHYSGIVGPYPGRDLSPAVTTDLQCAEPGQRSAVDDRFVGVWNTRGPVDQPSSTTTYQARLILRGGALGTKVGTSSYPGLGCDGDLTLRQANPDRLVLLETITADPQDTCVDEVRITLTVDGATLRYATGLSTATLVRDCTRPAPGC